MGIEQLITETRTRRASLEENGRWVAIPPTWATYIKEMLLLSNEKLHHIFIQDLSHGYLTDCAREILGVQLQYSRNSACAVFDDGTVWSRHFHGDSKLRDALEYVLHHIV